tara:strand:- start:1786 stop:2574 length:789 start_codon:yes stop_codon:yes gene_type:complete
MPKIATWNVNSIRARLPRVLEWLSEFSPDIVLLQEIKVIDEAFPAIEIEDLGYNISVHGQKTYNGVAILSKSPIEKVKRGLPGDHDDEQARYIEGLTFGIRVASLYLPNGNPVPGEKFDYKISWMNRLIIHTKKLLDTGEPFLLGGDYNVCPTDDDVYNPGAWSDDALCRPESRNRFRSLLNLGLTEAFRAMNPQTGLYSYWDYTGGAWQKDFGLRIDHLLLSPEISDLLVEVGIDKSPRGKEKPSDHTPVWCEISSEKGVS